MEVACYRIVTEALTNVTRHAHATRCSVRIQLDHGLDVDVRDDGVGLPEGWRTGVGIASMRERVTELGGTLVIEPCLPHGTRITAHLPASAGLCRPGATMTEPIRVLIADDHPLFRDGLIALLTDGPDTELAGAATNGTEAVDLAMQTQPDVVVMDLHMPGLNGIEATRRIVADSPHITVLVLTMFDDDDSIFSALRAGARGYLLKGADQEQIRAAIRAAANGEIIFGTQLAARVLAYFTTGTSAPPPVFPQLTDREREVLDLVAQGRANPAIAAKLGLSQKTVRNHVSNILTKLQVADRAQAIVQARDAGLGQQSRI